jgi:hypothetical protein
MKRLLLSFVAFLSLCSWASAWNDKGHMVVAKLAWDRLSPQQQKTAIDILKVHPHYAEFLAADCPDGFPEDQWVFLRGATWPDWIKNHHKSSHLSFPKWHYVNLPYVPLGSKLTESDFPAASPNVITQITAAVDKVKSGTAEEKAIYLCWLLHLVGDIHQPLHCAELFSERFRKGDEGGILLLVRIDDGRPQELHPLWDGLLGESDSRSSIGGTVAEIRRVEKDSRARIEADLAAHATPEAWAKEGLEAAKKYAYLDGKLDVANSEDHPADKDVPTLPTDYMKNAGAVARIAVAKAGQRLATALSKVL